VAPRLRSSSQLAAGQWEVHCPTCSAVVEPVPTDEDKRLLPTSIYAITKRDHEEMALAYASAYGVPAVALRFFNIYGSRQALSNPYTGVAAIFSGRILAGQPPMIFEDGLQQRDFVHVSDVVQACRLAMSSSAANNQALNVGSGQPVSVLDVAQTLASTLHWSGQLEITRQFRAGDIRHCFADITRIRDLLGYQPRYAFGDGVAELVRWVAEQQGVADRLSEAARELSAYGLVR
jgi:dTDP-L-rhamnose 4-epimerase